MVLYTHRRSAPTAVHRAQEKHTRHPQTAPHNNPNQFRSYAMTKNPISNFFKTIKTDRNKRRLFLVLLFAAFIRLFYIGNIPGNANLYVDEMFSGYEAWSILHYGIDTAGRHFAVYLPAWGSGMSVMQAYTQIPFIAIFGLNSFALRLPAAILGIITLYAFYYICKSIKNEDYAIFATFIMSILPWHVMMSRWALDCNYFVGFITITIALLIKASRNNKFLPLAFLFIGLTLYTYSLPWTVMPIFVLGTIIYMFRAKEIKPDRHFFIALALLVITGLPLLLFVAVNMGYMPELLTPIFSIPKLSIFRAEELSLSPRSMLSHITTAFNMFVNQDDGTLMGTAGRFGLYHKISGVFILIGLAECLVTFFTDKKRRGNEIYFILLFLCSFMIAATTDLYFYRINIIQMPMTYFLVNGLWFVAGALQHKAKEILATTYAVLFFFFFIFYITDYDDSVAKHFFDGNKSAIEFVNEQKKEGHFSDDNTIHAVSGISYVSVIFYEKYPTDQYVNDVVYIDNADNAREHARILGNYIFYCGEPFTATLKSGDIVICSDTDESTIRRLESMGTDIHYMSSTVVAVAP